MSMKIQKDIFPIKTMTWPDFEISLVATIQFIKILFWSQWWTCGHIMKALLNIKVQ